MAFKGYLSGLELTDVIQIINMKGASSVFEVEGPAGERGTLYILNGNVIYADIDGKIKGDEAALEIFSWDSPTFKELKWSNPPEKNITMDTLFLIMEAARLRDESSRNSSNSNTSQIQSDDKLIQFISSAKTFSEARKRALLTIAHNFPEQIITAMMLNSSNKIMSTLIHSRAKTNFWKYFRKISPAIKVSIENPEKPIYIPVEEEVDAIIFTKNIITLISLLKSTPEENNKLLALLKKITMILEEKG